MIVRVMDDDWHVGFLAQRLMPKAVEIPLSVLVYRTWQEVADALAYLPWDDATVAVIDVTLNGQQGWDVAEYLRACHPGIGVWGVTALWPTDFPEWTGRLFRRVFHKDSHFFSWLAQDIERFARGDNSAGADR